MADGAIPTEVKKEFDTLQKSLADIRTKQGEIDAELKKRGEADPLLKATLEKLEKAYEKTHDEMNALHRKAARPVVAETPETKRAT